MYIGKHSLSLPEWSRKKFYGIGPRQFKFYFNSHLDFVIRDGSLEGSRDGRAVTSVIVVSAALVGGIGRIKF